jgi:hypothetical protein
MARRVPRVLPQSNRHNTASASQVRRPIHDSSLTQWRHYEKQLEGLRGQLLAADIHATELE